ncbi:uncharacterized protein LOC105304710 isoform X1 [Pteropus vampyrus]|uniref:Uncharacterized protein LOC105304710 isoform X1 n=1 Tax=Pteropus vampyrus TaxID=132908 RepID=A0A6P6BTF5_PTEVA|nr:uncharacterized protein LOC105304710 isoform X1 [Pteropus vampyrus]
MGRCWHSLPSPSRPALFLRQKSPPLHIANPPVLFWPGSDPLPCDHPSMSHLTSSGLGSYQCPCLTADSRLISQPKSGRAGPVLRRPQSERRGGQPLYLVTRARRRGSGALYSFGQSRTQQRFDTRLFLLLSPFSSPSEHCPRDGLSLSRHLSPGLLVQCLILSPRPIPCTVLVGGGAAERPFSTAKTDTPSLPACGVDPKRVDRVFSWCLCPRRGPGARDNAHNEIVSNRNSQSTLVSEQELEQQEHTELAHVIVQSPGEAMRLLTIVLNHYY